MRFLVFVELY
jgi:hypothetical protein